MPDGRMTVRHQEVKAEMGDGVGMSEKRQCEEES